MPCKCTAGASPHVWFMSLSNATRCAAGGRRPADWDSYQDFILNDTAAFRPKADQSHYMPEGFFERWQELRAQGDEMGERIFLPINWCASCAAVWSTRSDFYRVG